MGMVARFLAPLIALVAAGCAQLTADEPLFSPADQGPLPIVTGVWIAVGEECPLEMTSAATFLSACMPVEMRVASDDAWRLEVRTDLINEPFDPEYRDPGPTRMVLAHATQNAPPGGYSRAYIAEFTSRGDDGEDSIGYGVIVPLGPMPATEFSAILGFDCDVVMRDGPIEGIDATHSVPAEDAATADGGQPHAPKRPETSTARSIASCVARTPSAVREAARRVVIENVETLQRRRFVRVGPVRR